MIALRVNRTLGLQIFSLTLSQLSYQGFRCRKSASITLKSLDTAGCSYTCTCSPVHNRRVTMMSGALSSTQLENVTAICNRFVELLIIKTIRHTYRFTTTTNPFLSNKSKLKCASLSFLPLSFQPHLRLLPPQVSVLPLPSE